VLPTILLSVELATPRIRGNHTADGRPSPRIPAMIEQLNNCMRKVSVNYYRTTHPAVLHSGEDEVALTRGPRSREPKSLTKPRLNRCATRLRA
jgi:hypothetical protein